MLEQYLLISSRKESMALFPFGFGGAEMEGDWDYSHSQSRPVPWVTVTKLTLGNARRSEDGTDGA
jgi:hypothetical protein